MSTPNRKKPGLEEVTPSGLCGCFEDFETCLLSWCCPLCMLGWNGGAIKNWEQGPPDEQPIWRIGSFSCLHCCLSCCCSCFACYFAYSHRGSMHSILGEPQDCCADCFACCCCTCCSQAQVGRQLKKVRKIEKEQVAGSVHVHYYGNSGQQSQPMHDVQPMMTPPQQPQYVQPGVPPYPQYMQPQQQQQYMSPPSQQQQQPQQQPQYMTPPSQQQQQQPQQQPQYMSPPAQQHMSPPAQQQQQQDPYNKGIN